MRTKCRAFVAFFSVIITIIWAQQPSSAQTSPPQSSFPLQEITSYVPNAAIVSPVLVRGGQPKEGGLERLKQAGIKTVVNLRDGQKDIESERQLAQRLGLKFVSLPMSVLKPASKEQINTFLSVVRSPENQPVFVHCRQGQDRCGTMVAAYRIAEQSWTADQSYKEMLKYGFHPIFLGLTWSIFSMPAHPERPAL